ncbi:MAG: DnaB-like helicase C-terminal domain-containing protein [Candidatus Nanoarchaeia archaeon]|nr:DnaB-like helicase C-terminal domain-containing protein [Candidatus Nanoarchaeia archaeon]
MLEDEEVLLCQIIIDNNILDDSIIQACQFKNKNTKTIFLAIQKCRNSGEIADLENILKSDKEIDRAYLYFVSAMRFSSADWERSERIIIREYQLEQFAFLGRTLIDMSDQKKDVTEILETTERKLFDITSKSEHDDIYSIGSLISGFIDQTEKRYKNKGKIPGLSTGIHTLDSMTLGLNKARLYYIGARPSQGKSALALNMALYLSINESRPVGFISLESSKEECTLRAFSSIGKMNGMDISTGFLQASDFGKINATAEKLFQKPLYFYDRPNMTLQEIKSISRRMVTFYKCEVIFIDYLQIIQHSDSSLCKRERIEDISVQLKNLARELDIPIVCLAQLRRDVDQRRPGLGDFSDSSQAEKDADVAILIYHEKENEDGEDEKLKSRLLVEKSRDGRTGTIDVVFKKEYVTFYEVEKHLD